MDLSALRSQLLANIHEQTSSAMATATLNAYVNAAMHHVGSWLVSLEAGYLLTSWSGTLENATSARLVFPDLSGADYPRVWRILDAQSTELSDDDEANLEIIRFESVRNKPLVATTDKPPIFAYNEGLGFLYPEDGTKVAVHYAHALPDMTADTDTPGEAGGSGDQNKIPLQFQPLIPSWAAVMVLSAENADAQQWQRIYEAQQTQLLASMPRRARTPQRG